MSLKMTFLGAGSAFTVGDGNFHSNILLEHKQDSLLIDAGSDLRRSLFALNKSYQDINNVYISHLHSDHIGGLEWLAINTFFDQGKQKPTLIVSENIIDDLWSKSLKGGLSTLADQHAGISTYFDLQLVSKVQRFVWQAIEFQLIPMIHIHHNLSLMFCYGLLFTYHDKTIFFTADTQFTPEHLMPIYEKADIIFHDCETAKKRTGVHAHFHDLKKLPLAIKNKMWLYHYQPGKLPDAKKEGFLGFVRCGEVFIYE